MWRQKNIFCAYRLFSKHKNKSKNKDGHATVYTEQTEAQDLFFE